VIHRLIFPAGPTVPNLFYRIGLAGTAAYVYFLFEHKSHPYRFIHVQVLKYIKPVWEDRRGRGLPVVVPVVVYHGRKPWPYDPQFSNVFPPPDPALRPYFPDFRIVLADLSRYSDDEIRGAVLTRAFVLLLKHIRAPDFPDRMPRILGLLKGLRQSRTALGHLEAMLRYIGSIAENITPEAVERSLLERVPEPEGERITPNSAAPPPSLPSALPASFPIAACGPGPPPGCGPDTGRR
jgi:hypothetical protein